VDSFSLSTHSSHPAFFDNLNLIKLNISTKRERKLYFSFFPQKDKNYFFFSSYSAVKLFLIILVVLL